MLLPTHNPQWRERWCSITDEIERLLNEETPDADQLIDLLKQRQRHLTAFSSVQPQDLQQDPERQQAWLDTMSARDAAALSKISDILEKHSRALTSYKQNKSALKRLRRKSITPQRHYIVTGHL